MTEVRGYCPMGCGRTLFLADDGYVTCSYGICPNPGAVDELLSDPESEHIVDCRRGTFSVQHPLRERLEGGLFGCPLHDWLSQLDWPPEDPGHRYRVHEPYGDSAWERIQ